MNLGSLLVSFQKHAAALNPAGDARAGSRTSRGTASHHSNQRIIHWMGSRIHHHRQILRALFVHKAVSLFPTGLVKPSAARCWRTGKATPCGDHSSGRSITWWSLNLWMEWRHNTRFPLGRAHNSPYANETKSQVISALLKWVMLWSDVTCRSGWSFSNYRVDLTYYTPQNYGTVFFFFVVCFWKQWKIWK